MGKVSAHVGADSAAMQRDAIKIVLEPKYRIVGLQ
jgi:hypothetical protein